MSTNSMSGMGQAAKSGEPSAGQHPDPLVPADVVLRDFAFFPLDITRLFNSRFHAIASDAEWRAGVTLWLKSYHQVPAGSLPSDDIELARLAEFGKNLKNFLKIKQVALHGWIECADGRLYHRTVAEKVNEAWTRKQQQRDGARKGNAKRWGTRHQSNENADISTPSVDIAHLERAPVMGPATVAMRSDTDSTPITERSDGDPQAITQRSPSDGQVIAKRSATDRSPVASIRDSIRDSREGKHKPFCTVPADAVSVPPADVFLTLPLVGDVQHPITTADVTFWHETYPAVDIEQAFRSMRAWLVANPTRRKTPRGIGRFVMAWLEREQNRGGSRAAKPTEATTATERHERRRAQALQWAREMMAEEGKNGGA
jgi:hypothetical protein